MSKSSSGPQVQAKHQQHNQQQRLSRQHLYKRQCLPLPLLQRLWQHQCQQLQPSPAHLRRRDKCSRS